MTEAHYQPSHQAAFPTTELISNHGQHTSGFHSNTSPTTTSHHTTFPVPHLRKKSACDFGGHGHQRSITAENSHDNALYHPIRDVRPYETPYSGLEANSRRYSGPQTTTDLGMNEDTFSTGTTSRKWKQFKHASSTSASSHDAYDPLLKAGARHSHVWWNQGRGGHFSARHDSTRSSYDRGEARFPHTSLYYPPEHDTTTHSSSVLQAAHHRESRNRSANNRDHKGARKPEEYTRNSRSARRDPNNPWVPHNPTLVPSPSHTPPPYANLSSSALKRPYNMEGSRVSSSTNADLKTSPISSRPSIPSTFALSHHSVSDGELPLSHYALHAAQHSYGPVAGEASTAPASILGMSESAAPAYPMGIPHHPQYPHSKAVLEDAAAKQFLQNWVHQSRLHPSPKELEKLDAANDGDSRLERNSMLGPSLPMSVVKENRVCADVVGSPPMKKISNTGVTVTPCEGGRRAESDKKERSDCGRDSTNPVPIMSPPPIMSKETEVIPARGSTDNTADKKSADSSDHASADQTTMTTTTTTTMKKRQALNPYASIFDPKSSTVHGSMRPHEYSLRPVVMKPKGGKHERYEWTCAATNTVRTLVHMFDKDAMVNVVGSVAFQLCLANSDLDLVVTHGDPGEDTPEKSKLFFTELQRRLVSLVVGVEEASIEFISARTPILSFIYGGGRVDVSLNQMHAIKHVNFFQTTLQFFPWMRGILLFLKRWIKARNIPLTKEGGMPLIAFMFIGVFACYETEDVHSFFELLAQGMDMCIFFDPRFPLKGKARNKRGVSNFTLIDPCASQSNHNLAANVSAATQLLYQMECKRVLRDFQCPLVRPLSAAATSDGNQSPTGPRTILLDTEISPHPDQHMGKSKNHHHHHHQQQKQQQHHRDAHGDAASKSKREQRLLLSPPPVSVFSVGSSVGTDTGPESSKLDIQKLGEWVKMQSNKRMKNLRHRHRGNDETMTNQSKWSLYLLDEDLWLGTSIAGFSGVGRTQLFSRKNDTTVYAVTRAILLGEIIVPLPQKMKVHASDFIGALDCDGMVVSSDSMWFLEACGYLGNNDALIAKAIDSGDFKFNLLTGSAIPSSTQSSAEEPSTPPLPEESSKASSEEAASSEYPPSDPIALEKKNLLYVKVHEAAHKAAQEVAKRDANENRSVSRVHDDDDDDDDDLSSSPTEEALPRGDKKVGEHDYDNHNDPYFPSFFPSHGDMRIDASLTMNSGNPWAHAIISSEKPLHMGYNNMDSSNTAPKCNITTYEHHNSHHPPYNQSGDGNDSSIQSEWRLNMNNMKNSSNSHHPPYNESGDGKREGVNDSWGNMNGDGKREGVNDSWGFRETECLSGRESSRIPYSHSQPTQDEIATLLTEKNIEEDEDLTSDTSTSNDGVECGDTRDRAVGDGGNKTIHLSSPCAMIRESGEEEGETDEKESNTGLTEQKEEERKDEKSKNASSGSRQETGGRGNESNKPISHHAAYPPWGSRGQGRNKAHRTKSFYRPVDKNANK